MASVRVTPSLSKFIHEAVEFTSNSELITDSKRLSLLKELDNGSISIPNIQLLSKCKRNDSSSPDMKYLLAGSQLQFHKSGPKGSGTSSGTDAYRNVESSSNGPNENAARDERHKRLLLLQEQRQYNMMVHGTEHNPETEVANSIGQQFNSARNQASIVLNMIVAIFSSFGIVYYISSQLGHETAQSMVHGTFGAIAMMVLEMVLFISRAMRIEGTYENKKNGTAIATRSSICSSNSPRPGLNHLGTGLLAGKPHDKGGSSMAAPVPTYHTAPVGGAWRGSNSSGDYMGHAKED